MRKTKRFLALLLIVQILIPSTLNVLAINYRYEAQAVVLNKLGIYAGGNVNYFEPDLGSQLQRQSAVILLVNMFGKKAAALAMTPDEVDSILSKYTDSNLLASFARPFMAYAVKTGMVNGTSKTTLGPTKLIDSPSFACMILKNMGYIVDSPAAFLHSLDILGGLGGMKPEETAALNNKILIRDDVVGIMFWALKAATADGNALISVLIKDGVISPNIAVDQGFIKYDTGTGKITLLPENSTVITDRDIIYKLIRDAMVNVSPSVVLPVNASSDSLAKVRAIVEDVLADNPKILYYTGSTYYAGSGLLELKYTMDMTTAKSHLKLLETMVKSILSGIIKPGMTDYQKELAIHDYIVNHCSYDEGADPPRESFSAYGALCLNTAVCDGYAKAAQLLFQKAGMECLLVTGTATDVNSSRGHSWNIVKISGQFYHLDISWDDPIMKDGSDVLIYTYFNLADKEIKRDHNWDAVSLPVCISATFNYYDFNGFIVKGYNEFVSFVVNKFNQGNRLITVKASDTKDPGFDMLAALLSIQNATHIRPVIMRVIDAYGIVDLSFK